MGTSFVSNETGSEKTVGDLLKESQSPEQQAETRDRKWYQNDIVFSVSHFEHLTRFGGETHIA